jgi:hypothetical protein
MWLIAWVRVVAYGTSHVARLYNVQRMFLNHRAGYI